MKYSKIISKYFILIVLLLSVFFSWVITTETGLQWSWKQIQSYLPKELTISEIRGQLIGQIEIQDLSWKDVQNEMRTPLLKLECNWFKLVFERLQCQTVEIDSMTYLVSQVETNNNSISDIPKLTLPQFSLPIAIEIDKLKIHQFQFGGMGNGATVQAPIQASTISLKNLRTHLSDIEFSKLAFKLPESDSSIVIKGKLNFKKQWQHQLYLAIESSKLNATFESYGKIDITNIKKSWLKNSDKNDYAKFKLLTSSPYQSEAIGEWYWNNGPVIKKGLLTGENQNIQIGQDKLVVNKIRSEFILQWPSLQFNSESNISWLNLEDIAMKANLAISDLTNWKSESKVVLDIKSQLSNELIAQLEARFLSGSNNPNQPFRLPGSDLSVKERFPISGAITAKVENGALELYSENVKIGNIETQFQASSNIDTLLTDDFSASGKLTADNLVAITGFPVESVKIDWELHNKHQQWGLNTSGFIGRLNHPEVTFTQLKWGINLDKHWNGVLNAATIKINKVNQTNDKNPLIINDTMFKLSGTSDSHLLDISFSANDSKPTNIKIAGGNYQTSVGKQISLTSSVPSKSKSQWKIKALEAHIPFAQRNYNVIASNLIFDLEKQEVGMLCIQEAGKTCIRGYKHLDNWKAEINTEKVSLQSLSLFAEHWGIILPFDIDGEMSGTANLSGTQSELIQLQVDLLSPNLLVKTNIGVSQWNNLEITSNKINGHYTVNSKWLSSNLVINNPDWQSKFETPHGSFSVSLAQNWDLSINANQENIQWTPPYAPALEKSLSFVIPKIVLDASIVSGKLKSNVSIGHPISNHIIGHFNSSWPVNPADIIDAQISIQFNQLDWLKQWQSRIDQLDASWQQKLIVGGTINNPKIQGKGEVRIANLEVEEIGVEIRDSQFNLAIVDEKIEILGSLKNKQGQLNLIGSGVLYPKLTGSLNIDGKHLKLLEDKENKVVVTPNIRATWNKNHLEVNGEILVDEAKLKISALPKQAITVSDDQIIIDHKQNIQSTFSYQVHLDIKTGELVYVDGLGLTSAVKGQLKTTVISGKPLKLNGQLSLVGGQFQAFKQVLTIEEGELLFLGTADNPSIQFRAVRKIDEIKVGVLANGSLANPRLTLYSQPAMSEENILALLLTGKTIESLSHSEGSALANAAISLGIEGANKIAKKIGSALGINELAISSKTAVEGTRVDVGAKINPNLSVGYGAIIDSNNELSSGWIIEYQLSKSISIEANSGEEITASLSFKKEMDKVKVQKNKKKN